VGYRFPSKTIRYEGDPDTDFTGLWIDVRQVRSGAEFMALTKNTYWADLHVVMAPFVLAWNVEGPTATEVERDAIGKLVPGHTATDLTYGELPPPAEAGPDVFLTVPVEVKGWIHGKLIESMFHRKEEAEAPKGKALATVSAPTPNGLPATMEAKTPARRSSSRKRSATT
jgi:hypothetical protein